MALVRQPRRTLTNRPCFSSQRRRRGARRDGDRGGDGGEKPRRQSAQQTSSGRHQQTAVAPPFVSALVTSGRAAASLPAGFRASSGGRCDRYVASLGRPSLRERPGRGAIAGGADAGTGDGTARHGTAEGDGTENDTSDAHGTRLAGWHCSVAGIELTQQTSFSKDVEMT